jgi:hypothetical protein
MKVQALVHVCRRWRQIIFESPRRLDLKVRCSYGTSVKKSILIWPNIPIALDYSSLFFDTSPNDVENIIIALEHSERVGHLELHLTDLMLRKLATLIEKPFPILTHLNILSVVKNSLLLPAEFLGGSAPSLQQISLSRISFPALPTLLSSARDLVTLSLRLMPPTDYISPEALVACLAALPRLKTFDIGFHPDTPQPNQIRPYPITRTVLHTLTHFQLEGAGEYLEDFATRVDCPRLNSFFIVYFGRLVDLQVPQLLKFFERLTGPEISPFAEATIGLDTPGVDFYTYRPMNLLGWDWHLARTIISSWGMEWQAEPLTQMLLHLSPMLSTVVNLNLEARVWTANVSDIFDWLNLLHQLSAVRALCVSQPLAGRIAHALKSFTGEMVAEALPSLDLIYLEDQWHAPSLDKFVSVRQLSGHPVTVVETIEDFDQRLECYLEK